MEAQGSGQSQRQSQRVRYPKPGPVGGRLLRAVVASLRKKGLDLPLKNRDVILAVSGGADSMAMAELLLVFGRRILGPECRVRVLHLDHGWRPDCSEAERQGVEAACRNRWGGPEFLFRQLQSPAQRQADAGVAVSWEAFSREKRLEVFDEFLSQGSLVFTAHHADDQAETLFWRFMRGEWDSHRQGILPLYERSGGVVVRPLLDVWKKDLLGFAREQSLEWFEDLTNQDAERMRGALRCEIFPLLEEKFPGFARRLVAAVEPAIKGGPDSASLTRSDF